MKDAMSSSTPLAGYSPIGLTKAIVIAVSVGVVVGIILTKLYTKVLSYLFGRGHLKGHSEERFNSFWVETTQGKVRIVRYRNDASFEKQPLVMLIHGYAGSLDVYADPQRTNYCEMLQREGHDVLAFDLYGHGGTDCPDTHFSAELFASQVAEICMALDVREPFTLVAHSMGSSVAVTFAHRYPNFVSKLVLLCPSIADCPMELRLRIALRIPFFREIISYFVIPTFGEGTNENNAGMLRACYRLLETRLRSGGSWNAGSTKTIPMLQQLAATNLSKADSILIMWGQADDVVQFNQAKNLALVAPNAAFSVLKDAGHMSFADGPAWMREYFASRIVAFLKGDLTPFNNCTIQSYFRDDRPQPPQNEDDLDVYTRLGDSA